MSEGRGPRLARAVDLPEVARVTLAAYRPFLVEDDPYAASLADAAGRASRGELWVLDGADRVAGAVTYCPPGSSMREVARDDEGEFRMLAVDPAAQGRGLGRLLVAHCLGRARGAGLSGVRLSSLVEMTDAHRLYERLGFVRAPEDDWTPVPDVPLLAYCLRWSP